jgi:filamentous hemagglutinin family protein
MGGDVVNEECGPEPRVFIINPNGMILHHENRLTDVEHGRNHTITGY